MKTKSLQDMTAKFPFDRRMVRHNRQKIILQKIQNGVVRTKVFM